MIKLLLDLVISTVSVFVVPFCAVLIFVLMSVLGQTRCRCCTAPVCSRTSSRIPIDADLATFERAQVTFSTLRASTVTHHVDTAISRRPAERGQLQRLRRALATLRSGRRPVGHLPFERFLAADAVRRGPASALAKRPSSRCRLLGSCHAGERVYHRAVVLLGHPRAS